MSAKNLRTLAMIYATGELQNPLHRKRMLCEGNMNTLLVEMMYFT